MFHVDSEKFCKVYGQSTTTLTSIVLGVMLDCNDRYYTFATLSHVIPYL